MCRHKSRLTTWVARENRKIQGRLSFDCVRDVSGTHTYRRRNKAQTRNRRTDFEYSSSSYCETVESLLGLASFYRKYVPDFAVNAAPLTDAIRKGNPIQVVWNKTRDHAFQELKRRISTPPILKLPYVTKLFIVQTDASHIGIGAVLLQEDAAGEKRPVAFASRKLQPRETHYSTIERECLAIVWGITKF